MMAAGIRTSFAETRFTSMLAYSQLLMHTTRSEAIVRIGLRNLMLRPVRRSPRIQAHTSTQKWFGRSFVFPKKSGMKYDAALKEATSPGNSSTSVRLANSSWHWDRPTPAQPGSTRSARDDTPARFLYPQTLKQ